MCIIGLSLTEIVQVCSAVISMYVNNKFVYTLYIKFYLRKKNVMLTGRLGKCRDRACNVMFILLSQLTPTE